MKSPWFSAGSLGTNRVSLDSKAEVGGRGRDSRHRDVPQKGFLRTFGSVTSAWFADRIMREVVIVGLQSTVGELCICLSH